MTVEALFYRRLIGSWKQKLKVWQLIVDWTIALYIVVPILGVFIYNYVALWTNASPWVEFIPLLAINIAYFLNACRGDLHYFMEEGDQLFLLQQTKWITGLRRRGVVYSVLSAALATDILTLLLLPIMLHQFGWSLIQVFFCALFSFLCKLYLSIFKQQLDHRYVGIRRFIYIALMYIAFALIFLNMIHYLVDIPIVLAIICLLLIYPLVRLLQNKVTDVSHFLSDIQRAQKELEKSRSFALGQAGIKKKAWYVPTSPLIFRKSSRLFKRRTTINIISENVFKIFFRKWSLVRMYMQYTVVISIAIAAVPMLWLKILLWILGLFLLMYWLKSYWKDVLESAYYQLMKFPFGTLYRAEGRTIWMLVAPAYSIVTVVGLASILI